jgi:hypothetical protein
MRRRIEIVGVHNNIGYERFPKQGDFLGRKVNVCFDYDTSKTIRGMVVRDDKEEPGTLLIRLTDDRIVNATECQYSLIREE